MYKISNLLLFHDVFCPFYEKAGWNFTNIEGGTTKEEATEIVNYVTTHYAPNELY